MNGILNVYKEKGYTSADVVARLRGILKTKKIGHTGTLDPDAEGVLPVCIGNATKVCQFLTDETKEYEAVLYLGCVTDTQDSSGTIVASAPDLTLWEGAKMPEDTRRLDRRVADISEDMLREAVAGFIGEQDQIPPMYSALKVGGKRLYTLAREGIEVERKPRRINISSIEITDIGLPKARLIVECSKGTYIRTLCNDIGEKLGCGAMMMQLLRKRVGRFELKDTLKLDEISALAEQGMITDRLVRVDELFSDMPAAIVKEQFMKAVLNGNSLRTDMIKPPCSEPGIMRVYGEDGTFYALYEYIADDELCKPYKMFL